MPHRLSILVLDNQGIPVTGTMVTVRISGSIDDGPADTDTDDSGYAMFQIPQETADQTVWGLKVGGRVFRLSTLAANDPNVGGTIFGLSSLASQDTQGALVQVDVQGQTFGLAPFAAGSFTFKLR